MVFNIGPYTVLPDNFILITANMQSETGFPSSHQLKSYVASKSRLKLAARAVLSADAGLLGFTFLIPAHRGSTGQRAIKRVLLLAVRCQLCSMNIFPVYGMEMVWYGDGAGNTVEENSSVFSLV